LCTYTGNDGLEFMKQYLDPYSSIHPLKGEAGGTRPKVACCLLPTAYRASLKYSLTNTMDAMCINMHTDIGQHMWKLVS